MLLIVYYRLSLLLSPEECTFEESEEVHDNSPLSCEWTNEGKIDDFDWAIHQGETSTLDTGPSFDHTLQTKQG